jgi:hypothetical protein
MNAVGTLDTCFWTQGLVYDFVTNKARAILLQTVTFPERGCIILKTSQTPKL